MLERFRHHVGHTRYGHDVFHIPGLFYKANGSQGGHVRLFRKPCKGLQLYAWNHYDPDSPLVERWYIPGLATLIRITPGKDGLLYAGQKAGWQVRFAKLQFKRIYGGVSIQWVVDKGYSA